MPEKWGNITKIPSPRRTLRGKTTSKIRDQKRNIRKNHPKFLKTPWTAGCPWEIRVVSRQNCPYLPFLVISFSLTTLCPPIPTNTPLSYPRLLGKCPIPVSVRFGRLLVSLGVLVLDGVGSGRGGSVRVKNITSLDPPGMTYRQ